MSRKRLERSWARRSQRGVTLAGRLWVRTRAAWHGAAIAREFDMPGTISKTGARAERHLNPSRRVACGTKTAKTHSAYPQSGNLEHRMVAKGSATRATALAITRLRNARIVTLLRRVDRNRDADGSVGLVAPTLATKRLHGRHAWGEAVGHAAAYVVRGTLCGRCDGVRILLFGLRTLRERAESVSALAHLSRAGTHGGARLMREKRSLSQRAATQKHARTHVPGYSRARAASRL